MKTAIGCYCAMALLTAVWFDGMDATWLRAGYSRSFAQTLFVATLWPISLPFSLYFIANPDCKMRWRLLGGCKQ